MAGALLTAVVIKFAGNVLKTFATVLALLATCFISALIFDFRPTPLFATGVAVTAASVWLYSRPGDIADGATWLQKWCDAMPAARKLQLASRLPPSRDPSREDEARDGGPS